MNEDHRSVTPVRPPAAYIGGKRNLSKRLTALIAATPHQTYAEAFVGMGGVFLKRSTAAPSEVINDFSGDVATFFRVLQRHYPFFMEMLRFQVAGRREFERLKASDPATLTDLERAARFLYLQRLAFGGKVAGRNFGVSPGMSSRFNITKIGPVLEDVHERLAGVIIENLPWRAFIERYDRPGTLFYLDPPYYGSEKDYGSGLFDRNDFEEMAIVLKVIKGRFILSINDRPEVRAIFSAFEQEGVSATYTIAGGDRAREYDELVITGGAV